MGPTAKDAGIQSFIFDTLCLSGHHVLYYTVRLVVKRFIEEPAGGGVNPITVPLVFCIFFSTLSRGSLLAHSQVVCWPFY